MMKTGWIVGLVLGMVGALRVQAGVLAGWEVAGIDVDNGAGIETNKAPYAFFSTTTDVGNVTARLVLGAGVSPSTATNQYGFKISGSNQTNSLEGAISLNHYMEFSLDIAAGYEVNLGSIEMNGGGTATGCSNVVLMTSIDGFVAGQEIASAYPANKTGGFDTDESGFGDVIDLSASRYQQLTGTVAFRLYGWNSSSGSGVTALRNLTGEDLVVFGEVVAVSGGNGGTPALSMALTNGMASVSVEFDSPPATNFVLQYTADLSDSNGWNVVSSPLSASTNWMFETTTNNAGFYRVVPEEGVE